MPNPVNYGTRPGFVIPPLNIGSTAPAPTYNTDIGNAIDAVSTPQVSGSGYTAPLASYGTRPGFVISQPQAAAPAAPVQFDVQDRFWDNWVGGLKSLGSIVWRSQLSAGSIGAGTLDYSMDLTRDLPRATTEAALQRGQNVSDVVNNRGMGFLAKTTQMANDFFYGGQHAPVVDTGPKPDFFGNVHPTIPDDRKMTEKIPFINDTLTNYEQSFDAAAQAGPNSGRINNPLGTAKWMTEKLKNYVDKKDYEAQPAYMKDDQWMNAYLNAPLSAKVSIYLPQTIEMTAPGVIGSAEMMLLTKRVVGGSTLAGSGVLAGSTANDVFDSAVQHGVDRDKAHALALGVAIPTAIMEKYGFDTILDKGPFQNFGKSMAAKIVKSMVVEGATEMTQEGVQMAAESTFRDMGMDEVKTRLLMSGLGGMMGGGFFSTVAQVFNNTMGQESLVNAEATQKVNTQQDSQSEGVQKAIKSLAGSEESAQSSAVTESPADLAQQIQEQTNAVALTKSPTTAAVPLNSAVAETVDASPVKDAISQAIQYNPGDGKVLNQQFIDDTISDLKPQAAAIETDPQKQAAITKSLDNLQGKQFSNVAEMLNTIDATLPADTDQKTRDLIIGQSLMKSEAFTDPDLQQTFADKYFSKPEVKATVATQETEESFNTNLKNSPAPEALREPKALTDLQERRDMLTAELTRYAPNTPQSRNLLGSLKEVQAQIEQITPETTAQVDDSSTPVAPATTNVKEITPNQTATVTKTKQSIARIPTTAPAYQATMSLETGKTQEAVQQEPVIAAAPTSTEKRTRGAKAFKQEIISQQAQGKITPEEAASLKTFINRWDKTIGNIAPEFFQTYNNRVESNKQGEYDTAQNIARIFLKESRNKGGVTRSTVHEVFHGLEQHLTSKEKAQLQKSFEKAKSAYFAKAPDQEVQDFQSGEYTQNNYRYKSLPEYIAETFTDQEMPAIKYAQTMKNGTALQKISATVHRIMHNMLYALKRGFGQGHVEQAYRNIRKRPVALSEDVSRNSLLDLSLKPEHRLYKDALGNKYKKLRVPTSQLVLDNKLKGKEFNERTIMSVRQHGYNEDMATQPVAVNKVGDNYYVIAGQSRVKGLQYLMKQNKPVTEFVHANVYEDLNDQMARRLVEIHKNAAPGSRILGQAKYIYDQAAGGKEFRTKNLRAGFMPEDYIELHNMIEGDRTGNLKASIQSGVISEPNALNIAYQSRTKKLRLDDTMGILQVIAKKGRKLSQQQFNRLADVVSLAKQNIKETAKQKSLFNNESLIDKLARSDKEVDQEMKRVNNAQKSLNQMQKISNEYKIPLSEDWNRVKLDAIDTAERLKLLQTNTLLKAWGSEPLNESEYLNKQITNRLKEADLIRQSNIDAIPALDAKANRVENSTRPIQVAMGRQDMQVDMAKVDELFAQGKIDEGLALRKQMMQQNGFTWRNGQWLKANATASPIQSGNAQVRGDLMDRTREDLFDKSLQDIEALYDGIERASNLYQQATEKTGIYKKMKDKIGSNLSSPALRFPEVWKEVLNPMVEYDQFTNLQKHRIREVYKKNKIKTHSESDYRIKRLKDGTATKDDIGKVTDKEINALRELDVITNEWFDHLTNVQPRIIKNLKGTQADIENSIDILGNKIQQRLEMQDGARLDIDGLPVQDKLLALGRALKSYDDAMPELKSLAFQWKNVSRLIGQQEKNLLTPERRVKYYVPRYNLRTEYEANKTKYQRQQTYLFSSLRSREADSFAQPNASLVALLDKYIRGMSYQTYLVEAYSKADHAAAQYSPSLRAEAEDYIEYMRNPEHVAAWSAFMTRAFSGGQLGIRTQLKNLAHGQGLVFAHGGRHYLKAWNMILTSPRKAHALLHNQNFLQDVNPEIYGTVGVEAPTRGKKTWQTIDKWTAQLQKMNPASKLMQGVEAINRPVAYLAGYLEGVDKGLTGKDLDYNAWNMVNKTQFMYGNYTLPKGFRKGFGRMNSQYTLTRLRDMEQVVNAFANKDFGFVVRYMVGKGLLFAALAALWPQEKRLIEKATGGIVQYGTKGIDFWEGLDFLGMKDAFSSIDGKKSAIDNVFDATTAYASGWMSPITQLMVHLVGLKTPADEKYNPTSTRSERVMNDLKSAIPAAAAYTDIKSFFERTGVKSDSVDEAFMRTIQLSNKMINEAAIEAYGKDVSNFTSNQMRQLIDDQARTNPKIKELVDNFPMYRYAYIADVYFDEKADLTAEKSALMTKITKAEKNNVITHEQADKYRDEATHLNEEDVKQLQEKWYGILNQEMKTNNNGDGWEDRYKAADYFAAKSKVTTQAAAAKAQVTRKVNNRKLQTYNANRFRTQIEHKSDTQRQLLLDRYLESFGSE